ncbi:hypothetical protein [Flaviaesturariibacter terrae]
MNVPAHYSESLPLREQSLYVLSLMRKGAASEVAAELMELRGTAAEDGVADLTIEVARELDQLEQEGILEVTHEHREKRRYVLRQGGSEPLVKPINEAS